MTNRLILFDIDGTLLHPRGSGRESTRRALLEVFGTTAGIETHNFGGKTDWQTLIELMSAHGYDSDQIGALMPQYMDAIRRHLSDIIADYPVEACPGALDLVADLRRRAAPLGIITGNVATTAPIKLRAAGFDPDWFPVGAFGSESPDRNDLPALALARAVEHYQRAIHADQVIIVGDTPMDIACARAIGATAVAVGTGYCPAEELLAAQPDYFLEDLTQFGTVLAL
jgi:phosphoglycolate phosphatase-like HAD superfamily hydrolase